MKKRARIQAMGLRSLWKVNSPSDRHPDELLVDLPEVSCLLLGLLLLGLMLLGFSAAKYSALGLPGLAAECWQGLPRS